MRNLSAGVSTLCLVLVFGAAARGEPLAHDVCEPLKAERQALLDAGVGEVVRNGPAWAKANVGPDKIKAARRYIELQEQLLFRCGLAKLKVLAPGGGDEGGEPAADAASPAAAAKPVQKKPASKAHGKAEGKVAGSEPAAEAQVKPKAKPAPKAHPKPKAKVDDAYRPDASNVPQGGAAAGALSP